MSYDSIAARYDEFVDGSFIHQVAVPSVLDLCVPGGRVLDVACGQGVLTRALAARYTTVVGVDFSAALVQIAEAQEPHLSSDLSYVVDDARMLDTIDSNSFDGATICLATTDFDDLDQVLGAVARVLVPGGWLVIAALHPCFEPPWSTTDERDGHLVKVLGNYFQEGRWWPDNPDSLLRDIGRYHRTLSTLLNTVLDSGFALERFEEPRPDHAVAFAAPIYAEVAEVLALRARQLKE
ncbi:MAG: methyltransferase domain-containing protein [Acidimicrobiia bacterium]